LKISHCPVQVACPHGHERTTERQEAFEGLAGRGGQGRDGGADGVEDVAGGICYTVYKICALRKQPTKVEKYEELKLLNDLREKGVITQEEFDDKKAELLG
jgi:hypothetical protein